MYRFRFIYIVLLVVLIHFGICMGDDNLKNLSQFRIVTTEEPPTNYKDQNKLVGTTVDIIEEIKRYLNLKIDIEVMPWTRSYKIAKEKPNVVIFTAGRTKERIDHGFHFIGPVITRKHALWRKAGNTSGITSIQDIKSMNLFVGSMRGDWRSKFFKGQGVRVQEVGNNEQNILKLLRGRIHLWISSDIEIPPLFNKLGVDMKAIELAYVFKEASSYIMISRDTPKDMVEKWQKAYADIQKSDFFQKASKKWGDILGLKLEFSNDKGFFVKE